MDEYESLSHTKWECKYHVVFIPKCRRRTLYEELRRHLGEVFRRLALQKESRVEEGHLMPDHVHMMLAIPPKYAVSQVVGYMKGKSAMKKRPATGTDLRLAAGGPAVEDMTRIRNAGRELLDAIHEKMAGVTEKEVLALLEADWEDVRKQTPGRRQYRAGERPRRRAASA